MNKPFLHRLLLFPLFLALAIPAIGNAFTYRGSPVSRESYLIGSARSAGMGHLTVLLEDGGAAVWNNPGMLAFEDGWFIRATYSDLSSFLDDDFWIGSITGGGAASGGENPILVGLGYTRFSLGESDIISEQGDSLRTFSSHDDLINLSVAVPVHRWVGIGICGEITHSFLSPEVPEIDREELSATALSFSGGIAFRPEFRAPIRTGPGMEEKDGSLWFRPLVGVSLLHWGQKMVYSSTHDGDDLPRRAHFGAGFRMGFDGPGGKDAPLPLRLLAADLFCGYEWERYLIGDEETIRHFGAELRLARVLSIRLGSIDEEEDWVEGTTRGIGIGFEDLHPVGFRIDYGESPSGRYQPGIERWEAVLFYNAAK